MATAAPLMPKATAVWLLDNTALSFDQIADFFKLHPPGGQAIRVPWRISATKASAAAWSGG